MATLTLRVLRVSVNLAVLSSEDYYAVHPISEAKDRTSRHEVARVYRLPIRILLHLHMSCELVHVARVLAWILETAEHHPTHLEVIATVHRLTRPTLR